MNVASPRQQPKGTPTLNTLLRPDDPPGSTFCMYPGPPLPEEWAYIVDDHCISYGPGPWPFYRLPMGSGPPEPSAIRVAPDSEFVSWGHEYVTLQPDQFGCVNTTIHVEIRRCIIVRVDIRFDLRERTWLIGDRCPAQVREQAEAKAERLMAAIGNGFAEQQAGAKRPITAYERWTAHQSKVMVSTGHN